MLTEKQSNILEYIRNYQMECGHSPTFEEIRVSFGFSSLNSVFKHLKALELKGYIQKNNQARGIHLLEDVKETLFSEETDKTLIPLYGSIPAGDPQTVEGNIIDTINVSHYLLPKQKEGVFLLEVTGDSMDKSGIVEGDIVIVDSQKYPHNHDIVVALVDGANTLKRYTIDSNRNTYLSPDSYNEKHKNIIPVHEAFIQGVVTASFRVY